MNENDRKLEANSAVLLTEHPIIQFTCYAPGGIGYAFHIHVKFKNPNSKDWHTSDRLTDDAVCVWQMKSVNLKDIHGIEEKAEVQLVIEVSGAGALKKNIEANQSFYYGQIPNIKEEEQPKKMSAYYEASGTTGNAHLKFIKYREPE